MARKYGKKIEIKLDPLHYNIGLIGESGIGKSTLIKQVYEKLAGEDGYLALDIGKECGHAAIHGIVSEPVPDWAAFEDIVEDIVENRFGDYADLKVVIIDTIDQLFEIAEPEVIRLHNIAFPEKRVDSVKAAFGGFMAGEDRAIQLVLDKIWELRNVGVSAIIIGHTKKRDIEDVMTGTTYSTLTTNMSQRYFNAIKTKLHVLGVAYVDREIIKQRTGKKNIVTKQEEMKGKVISESRKISFRDDNFSIDSKSRFADIVDSIPFAPDAFIQSLTDAIVAEHGKTGKSLASSRKEQEAEAAQNADRIKAEIAAQKEAKATAKRSAELMEAIRTKFSKADSETKQSVKKVLAEHGIKSFRDANIPTEALETIAKLLAA